MTDVATERPAPAAVAAVPRRQTFAEFLTFPSLAILKRETVNYMRQRKTALWKDAFREVRKTKSRFFSIFLIVALGAGFFAGIMP